VILAASPALTKAIDYNLRGGFLIDEPRNKYIYFNPWSINLYNEDIVEILASKGLIAIELDERVIGNKENQVEYLSKNDFPTEWLTPTNIQRLYPDEVLNTTATEGMLYFCQHVIHIVLVAAMAKQQGDTRFDTIDVWNHICLGSDFDGLITPLSITKDATALGNLFNDTMRSTLQAMAVMLNNFHPNITDIIVPFDVVNKIRWSNGFEFMRINFA
jgi:microsomal dipeptidase-like Zn-dependent dipeptidase